MLKKCLALVLTLMLLFSAACAEPAYSMLDKLIYQFEAGSGLKGSFSLNSEAYSFTCLRSHGVMQFVAELPSRQVVVYHQDGTLYLVEGDVLSSIPVTHDSLLCQVLDDADLPGIPGFTAGIYPRIRKNSLFTEWVFGIETNLDMWLSGFLDRNESEKTPEGETLMRIHYTVPAADFAAKLCELLQSFAENGELLSLLQPLMSTDEAARFLNPNNLPAYFTALSGLGQMENLEITSLYSVSTGESQATLSLPLAVAGLPYNHAEVTIRSNGFALTLSGEKCGVSFDLTTDESTSSFAGNAGVYGGDSPFDVAFSGMLLTEETVSGDITRHGYTLLLSVTDKATGNGLADLSADIAFRTGSAKNVATLVEMDISLQAGDESIALKGNMQTTAPWNMASLDTASAVPLTETNLLTVLANAFK